VLRSAIDPTTTLATIVLNKTLSVLLVAQIVLCVLSAGFSPAILIVFVLMIAAPISFLRSMAAHGTMFLLLPWVAGMLLFQGMIISPVFLGWFALIIVASSICWNRGGKPQLLDTPSR
jgi:hypothetical protein